MGKFAVAVLVGGKGSDESSIEQGRNEIGAPDFG
jgi:hypothetical protein